MGADEEARAHAVLAEMQLRISQGPTSALGTGEIVTPEEVRAAFLALTKQFHPARFGRLSPDLQKLANEVFLGIKGAHDHLLKVLGSSAAISRGGSARGAANAIPIATPRADGTSRTPTSTPARGTHVMSPRIDPGTQPPQSFARGTDRDGHAGAQGGRVLTPAMGVSVGRPGAGPVTPAMGAPTGARPVTPAMGVSTGTRPSTPVPPGTVPGVGSPLRAAGSAGTQRPSTLRPGEASSPLTPPTQPPRPRTLRPGEAASPLTPPTQPPRPRTLRPGEAASPLTPPTQPPRPITLRPGEAASPLTPPTQPPRGQGGDAFNPPTVRNVAPPPATARTDKYDDAAVFREAAALMEQKNWPAAIQALTALADRVPYNKSYRAWLSYARGREAYIHGRPNDAIAEMQRALQFDPNHAHARHALTELQRRR